MGSKLNLSPFVAVGESTLFRCDDNTLVSGTDTHFTTTCLGDGTYAVPAAGSCRAPVACTATLGVPDTNLQASTTDPATLSEFDEAVYECEAGKTLNPSDPGVTPDGKLGVKCMGATFANPTSWPTC